MILKPLRHVNRVYLHCTASQLPLRGKALVDEIRLWHLARGFVDIGYHYVIDTEGTVLEGRPLEQQPAAQSGYNQGSIAICCHGLEVKDFSIPQLTACGRLCNQLWVVYEGALTYHGHCEVSVKTCPVFDYKGLLNLDVDGRMRFTREQIIASAGPIESFGASPRGDTLIAAADPAMGSGSSG